MNSTTESPLRKCVHEINCVNPLGAWQPEDKAHFFISADKQGFRGVCKACSSHLQKLRRAERLTEIRQRDREYYNHHRDEIIEAQHQRRLRDGGVVVRSWRFNNKDKVREATRTYSRSHKDVRRAIQQKRRARKLNAPGTHTAADIRLLLKSQKNNCWWCGKNVGDNYHVDHRIPLSRGGSNAPENLCISCPECNLSKHTKLPQEWNGRLL